MLVDRIRFISSDCGWACHRNSEPKPKQKTERFLVRHHVSCEQWHT